MAAATVNYRLVNADPNYEVVQLDASDGETYTSQKFGVVNHAVLTLNDDSDAAHNAVTDGTGVVTININGGSDVACTLVLYGNLGN